MGGKSAGVTEEPDAEAAAALCASPCRIASTISGPSQEP